MNESTYQKGAFNCPHCGIYAQQSWGNIVWQSKDELGNDLEEWEASLCQYCKQYTFWFKKELYYPMGGLAPNPHPDMPEDIKADYIEAASIVQMSPRGASALLRLCVEKLCIHLGKNGKGINEAIKQLVEEGMPEIVQQAFDTLRVIGNQAVHAGKMDLKDDIDTALALFHLLNYVVEDRITRVKLVDTLYYSLPDSVRKAISKRDGIA